MDSKSPSAAPRRNALELECDSDLPLLSPCLLPTVRAFIENHKALSLKHGFSPLYNSAADRNANPIPQALALPALPSPAPWVCVLGSFFYPPAGISTESDKFYPPWSRICPPCSHHHSGCFSFSALSLISLRYMEQGELRVGSDCSSLEHERMHSSSLVLRTCSPGPEQVSSPAALFVFSLMDACKEYFCLKGGL